MLETIKILLSGYVETYSWVLSASITLLLQSVKSDSSCPTVPRDSGHSLFSPPILTIISQPVENTILFSIFMRLTFSVCPYRCKHVICIFFVPAISLIIIFFRLIHVVNDRISFFFSWVNDVLFPAYTFSLSRYPPVNRQVNSMPWLLWLVPQ